MTVLAVHDWRTNADLIVDCARLGYLEADRLTLDPTHGRGTWWQQFRPRSLRAHDIDPGLAPDGPADFTALPYRNRVFDAVAFDPPYKLNGTPSEPDARYGVHVVRSWQERHDLIVAGVRECARVLAPGGFLLVKVQDQVCSGQVRWQTDMVSAEAGDLGLRKVDALHMLAYRPQPKGRRQVHARRNHSTLLVFGRSA